MAANAPVMTKAALVEGRTDVGVLPTGQVVGVIDSLPTVADIVASVMARRTACCGGGAPKPAVAVAVAAAAGVALGHAAQQVRHPLVRHTEEVGDARDALSLGAQRHDERTAEIAARLGLPAQDRAHQLHGPGLVLVAEDRLPLASVLPGQADIGDPLGEQPLTLGVLPQHGFQLVERVQHVVGTGPAPVVLVVRHCVLRSSSLRRFLTQLGRICGQHAVVPPIQGRSAPDPISDDSHVHQPKQAPPACDVTLAIPQTVRLTHAGARGPELPRYLGFSDSAAPRIRARTGPGWP